MDVKDFFDRLGLNGSRWQWRVMRWERRLRELRQGGILDGSGSATRLLLGINLLLFALMVVRGMVAGQGLSPLFNPDGYLLVRFGAQYWPLAIVDGEWWRCITYAFTHGGLIHLGFNMMVLHQIGPMLEAEIGTLRFVSLYVLTALTATLAGLGWQAFYLGDWVTVVGASGSLFGMIGFAITYFHRIGGTTAHTWRNQMLRWAAIAFVFGLVVNADNAGHLGGAVGGALFGLILPLGIRGRQVLRPLFNGLGAACILVTAASLLMLVASWFF